MNHKLKIWPQYYVRVRDGSKTFEVRENDREFQSGDTVELMEWDPEVINTTDKEKAPRGFTDSPHLHFTIGYIYVLDKKTVVFSLLDPPKTKTQRANK